MWIVKVALNRPYTFIVLALLILIAAPVAIVRTPTDIFPNINIPVVSIGFQYTGLNPEELQGRLTTPYEKVLTTLVDNIQHIESTTYNGVVNVKVYLQPGASLDTANAQVTAASQYTLRQLPPGVLPPQIINFSASSVPILQLGISGEGLSEQQLNDYALNFIRPQLITVNGSVVPSPYGGKQRQITIAMDQDAMQSKGIAPGDLLNAVAQQNVVMPSGTIKIGQSEYDVHTNGTPTTVEGLGAIPLRQVNGTTIYLRDVATVSDGFQVQTNIVRQDGRRGVLISIIKNGNSSTLDVVKDTRALLPRVLSTLPPQLRITPIGDQSVFVRSAVSGVIREATIAAALTALMILLFLGSWRSTIIIAVSIPLSILTSIMVLSALGETINTMTLGGLALAVGILVDDATVTIENIERFLEEGHPLREAILEGAAQIAVPALVSTLCICIVFLPMFFLGGVARYLFVPLAEAVVFAMLASYILSRTLVPTLAMYLLRHKDHTSTGIFSRFQRAFERGFERLRNFYSALLERLVDMRKLFVPCFVALCLFMFILLPFLGQDFFPSTDSGQFILHVRGTSGLRIEEMARLCDLVEDQIRKEIPPKEIVSVLDNIGMPYSSMNTQHLTNGTIGANDADIMVNLTEDHHPTPNYVRALRKDLPRLFPDATFYMLPADITTQILNFGIPAPIDIQFEATDVNASKLQADKLLTQLRQVPGLTDLRVQQPFDYPTLQLDVDRTKALQGGYTARDVTTSVLNTLSGSFQVTPMFFLNWKNHVNYNMVAQTPQYKMGSMQDLENIPINQEQPPQSRPEQRSATPEILGDLASVHRGTEMAVINEYNVRPVIDIYGSVQDRDLGSVSRDIQKNPDAAQKDLPRGMFVTLKGQVVTMHNSYIGLSAGSPSPLSSSICSSSSTSRAGSIPSSSSPRFPPRSPASWSSSSLTHTTLSVPALMGAIMCMGVATANSILVISFAKTRLEEHSDAIRAALEAGSTRFRPVIMTALAMIIGMVPMALGVGDGGEQNAPLGRAVIGGLLCATVATLVFVPCVFALIHGSRCPQRGTRPQTY